MRLLAVLAALTPILVAQQRVSLAGEWQIAPVAAGAGGGEPAWHPVQVPAAFETALGTTFDGVARYRRTLPLPATKVAHVRIEFAAVATEATVFCNGVEVGKHLGGWTPFRVDVTSALQWNGNDVLEVLVDEKVGHNTQGFLPIIQPHFGGIWQDVTLCLDDGPVLDRLGLSMFGTWRPQPGSPSVAGPFSGLCVRAPVIAATRDSRVRVELLGVPVLADDGSFAAGNVAEDGPADGSELVLGTWAKRWAPSTPQLYTASVTLFVGDRQVDRIERRVGFRALRADGTRVLWHREPFQMRGVLHWGYSPPHLAPPVDPAYWRPRLERYRAMGFNTLKCCLWVPPRCVYELCDELGLAVWQEYPTWHPQMDQAHKAELLAEYAEFFAHDRGHPSVAFRSITCETGHGADLDVVKALFDACKAAVPETLVVDDSSWIGWQRVADFWDEHPYGNNSWFPGRLDEFAAHVREHGVKPLLLGECIAADTWVDAAAWRARHGDAATWWRPDCWNAQVAAERWLAQETDAATVASLRPASLDFAMRNRKFQIEQLRMRMPDAGYVVSVARDFAKARMGLDDDLDQPKWPAAAWQWHGDTMLCLDQAWHGRAVTDSVRVRVAHQGRGPLRGTLRLWSDAVRRDEVRVPLELQPGSVSEPVVLPLGGYVGALTRVRIRAELDGTHPAANRWDVWRVPAWHYLGAHGAIATDHLTPELLGQLEAGARVLLLAGDRKGSPRTEGMWFLKGAPFAPPHPLHARVPADALLELCSFDLESGRVMPWAPWEKQVDPILGFWETHDVPEVRFHLFAFATRVGKGRLLATTWNLDLAGATSPVRMFVRQMLCDHLVDGPEPARALAPATIAALRAQLTEKRIELPVWRFRTDANDEGRAANWQDPKTDVTTADWRDLKAGSHWENQADDLKQYTGVAWYRVDVAVPADWQGLDARAVFEGVDDSFEAWLDGEPIGRFGDPATKTTVWLERQVAELGTRLRAGATNTFVLRVVDHAGAGGLWKPVFLTTAPAARGDPLLH